MPTSTSKHPAANPCGQPDNSGNSSPINKRGLPIKPQTNFFFSVGSLLLIYLIWKFAAFRIGREIILPSPESTAKVVLHFLKAGEFWVNFSATLVRGLIGFTLSYLMGLLFGLCAGVNPFFDAVFRPVLVTIRSTPSMSLILLALIWFKSNAVTVFVTFLVVFPLVAQNVTEGIRHIDPALTEMAYIYRVKPYQILTRLYLPAILPYLAAGAVAGLGITWKVMTAAEVLAAPRWGIGTQMDQARIFLNTTEVFAWTAILVGLGYFFDRSLDFFIQKKLLHWKE